MSNAVTNSNSVLDRIQPPAGYFPPVLTFGVEYEFLYAFQKQNLHNHFMRPIENLGDDVKNYLRHRLEYKDQQPSVMARSRIEKTSSDIQGSTPEPDSWFLTNDASLGCDFSEVAVAFNIEEKKMRELWNFRGIELISPPMNYDYMHGWIPQLVQVDTVLSGICNKTTGVYTEAAIFNETTGFHVHISYPDMENEANLMVLKYVAIIWAVCEHDIGLVHPRHRHHSVNKYAPSLRAEFDPYSHKAFADGIYAAKDLMELQALIGCAWGYSQVKFSDEREGKPLTIEFRQHRGTCYRKEVIYWIKFCAGVVRLAHSYVAAGFDIRNPVALDELQKKIWLIVGLQQEEIDFFRNKMQEYADPEWEISLRSPHWDVIAMCQDDMAEDLGSLLFAVRRFQKGRRFVIKSKLMQE